MTRESEARSMAERFFGCKMVDRDVGGVAGERLTHGESCQEYCPSDFKMGDRPLMGCEHLTALLLSATSSAEERAREECAKVVREKCVPCLGRGWVSESITREAHGCDGSEASCSVTCPVPVEDYQQIECEHCGRPMEAIRSLRSAGKPGEGKEIDHA